MNQDGPSPSGVGSIARRGVVIADAPNGCGSGLVQSGKQSLGLAKSAPFGHLDSIHWCQLEVRGAQEVTLLDLVPLPRPRGFLDAGQPWLSGTISTACSVGRLRMTGMGAH